MTLNCFVLKSHQTQASNCRHNITSNLPNSLLFLTFESCFLAFHKTSADMDSEELQPCDLGTLDYWERRYQEEIKNFKSHGDTGEVWFGEDILERVVSWICKCELIAKDSSIVDIGCGNGLLLVELANWGFKNLKGIDYSKKAIILAEKVAEKFDVQNVIAYAVCDILQPNIENTFDVIVDKGTYDAISLSENGLENRKKYINNVYNLLKSNGLLVLTSCNWTKGELDKQYGEKFVCFDVIPTPQFQFGGSVGNVVTCVIFKKK